MLYCSLLNNLILKITISRHTSLHNDLQKYVVSVNGIPVGYEYYLFQWIKDKILLIVIQLKIYQCLTRKYLVIKNSRKPLFISPQKYFIYFKVMWSEKIDERLLHVYLMYLKPFFCILISKSDIYNTNLSSTNFWGEGFEKKKVYLDIYGILHCQELNICRYQIEESMLFRNYCGYLHEQC